MRHAFATFLMRGDAYLPGALVLAYALKMQSDTDCLCLVTDDVSNSARHALGILYDNVIPIQEIRHQSAVKGGRDDRKLLFTRFQALRLGVGGGLGLAYDKILLLDADVLPVGAYDTLFTLDAPAGIIMENKTVCYSGHEPGAAEWHWHKHYAACPHGVRIPREITDRVRFDTANMGVNSGLWLLAPSMKEYCAVTEALDDPAISELAAQFPWPEMQLATLLWSGRWTNVDIRYCSIGGYPQPETVYGIHYAGLKPWQRQHRSIAHYAGFPDFQIWYRYFKAMYWQYTDLQKMPGLQKLWAFVKDV
jgi:glycogenin glucosyltransferase